MKRKTYVQVNPSEQDLTDFTVEAYTVADVSDALSIEDAHSYCDDENAPDYGNFGTEWN